VAGAGLLRAGAGSLNVVAALQLPSASITIAGEAQVAGGYWFSSETVFPDRLGFVGNALLSKGDDLILGQDDVIIWGERDVIIWVQDDVIIWGEDGVIIWGENLPLY
jgi:hypothetical protein